MSQLLPELIRIENGKISSSRGTAISNLCLSVIKNGITGVICRNPNAIDEVISVLLGEKLFNSGKILINETVHSPEETARLLKKDVYCISEDSPYANELTIAENIFINSSFKKLFINKYKITYVLTRLFDELNIQLNFFQKAKNLNPFDRCIAELYSFFLSDKHVLVLKNLSIFLTQNECEQFFHYIESINNHNFGVLVFDYDLKILEKYCFDFYLIKHGYTSMYFPEKDGIRKYINIHRNKTKPKYINSHNNSNICIEFKNIAFNNLKKISFKVYIGSIVIITFSRQQEYHDLLFLLKNRNKCKEGEILFAGKKQLSKHNTNELMIIPFNEIASILNYTEDVMSNCILEILSKTKHKFITHDYYKSIIKLLNQYATPDFFSKMVVDLDYKEKIKVIFMKIILRAPKLVIFLNPFIQSDEVITEQILFFVAELTKLNITAIILSLQHVDFMQNHNMITYHISDNGYLLT